MNIKFKVGQQWEITPEWVAYNWAICNRCPEFKAGAIVEILELDSENVAPTCIKFIELNRAIFIEERFNNYWCWLTHLEIKRKLIKLVQNG